MTNLEMSDLFGLMILAWPNAEMFKGGVEKLGPTIMLWNKCLPDLDYALAEQAVIRLCRKCKFPPTMAEMREQAEEIKAERRQALAEAEAHIGLCLLSKQSIKDFYKTLGTGSLIRRTIDRMGGPEEAYTTHESLNGPTRSFDWERFRTVYLQVIAETTSVSISCTQRKYLTQNG